MYAVYNYKAGATQAQVVADIVLLLTGTTSTASLSASCVTANSSITSTVAAGWAVYDAAAGTNTQCVRALNQDASTYKYVTVATTSATVLTVQTYESWNAGTHVGTNACATASSTTVDLTGGGYLYIYATAKNFLLMSWTTAGYQSMTQGVLELSRDNIPAGYPCAVHLMTASFGVSNSHGGQLPRYKHPTSAGDVTGANAYCGFAAVAPTAFGTSGWTSPTGGSLSSLFRDASENAQLVLYPLGGSFIQSAGGAVNIPLGLVYDIKATSVNNASSLDELSYSGTTYAAFKASNLVFLVPKA